MYKPWNLRSRRRSHVIAAAIAALVIIGGTAAVQAAGSSGPGLMVSGYTDLSSSAGLSRATVGGEVFIYLTDTSSTVTSVDFFIDDPKGAGAVAARATQSPFLLKLQPSAGLDTSALDNGAHSVLAVVTTSTGSSTDVFARFTVKNADGATTAPVSSTPTAPAQTEPAATTPAATVPTATTTGAADASSCATTAAKTLNWGEPTYASHFNGTTLDPTWHPYGPETGHGGNGMRTPEAIKVADGNVTITGDAQGNTGAMKWFPGQQYGRWEICEKVGAGSGYNPVLLLWPDAEDWPVGGEIDWAEISGDSHGNIGWFLHYGADNQQTSGSLQHNSEEWTAYALEWTPTSMTAYVNGKVWHEEKDPKIFPPGPMNMCVQLDNFNAGGTASMSVDWTMQWALPESKPSTLGLAPGEPATGHPEESPDKKPRPLTVAQMLGKAASTAPAANN